MAATYAQIRDAAADAILAIVTNGAAEVQINGRVYKAANLTELQKLFDWASAQAAIESNGRVTTGVVVFGNAERGRSCD
jgi:hypothetical protein